MKNVIVGTVLASTEREIKNGNEVTKFYENMVDFGDGAVIISSGKALDLGSCSFTISPRTMYDRKAKISPVFEVSAF